MAKEKSNRIKVIVKESLGLQKGKNNKIHKIEVNITILFLTSFLKHI